MVENKKLVAVVLHILQDQPWGELVRRDIENGLALNSQIELEFADPRGDAALQARMLREYLERDPAALIVLPIDPDATIPILRKYKEKSIPVIVLDNDIGREDLYEALILADNRQFGRRVGEFLAEVMDGRGEIVEIKGITSTTGAIDRSAGFREALADHPSMKIIDELVGDWLYDKAYKEFVRALAKHKKIDAVYAQSDEMARAAYDAACEAGRDEEMLITGIDALKGEKGGLKMVMQGKLAATFINPSPGKEAVDALEKLLGGGKPMKKTLLYTSPMKSSERIRQWQQTRQK